MPGADAPAKILKRFGLAPPADHVIDVGAAGGFSGARLWRISAGPAQLCLRRWPPEHPSRERLSYIHDVLRYVDAQGFHLIPVPLRDATGQSVIEWEGSLWEVTPWLPGVADYHAAPSPTRLAAAMLSLARFHQTAACFSRPEIAPSPGLIERARLLRALQQGAWQRLINRIQPADWPEFWNVARRIVPLVPEAVRRIRPQMDAAAEMPTPLQPCIRDIWHDHVLFTGEEVTGIVDFGALRQDSIASDIARLLGSLVEDDACQRRQGLAAYSSVRPLSPTEQWLVQVFDQSGLVLGGVNWLRWIYVDRRSFHDRQRVVDRVEKIATRLQKMT